MTWDTPTFALVVMGALAAGVIGAWFIGKRNEKFTERDEEAREEIRQRRAELNAEAVRIQREREARRSGQAFDADVSPETQELVDKLRADNNAH